MMNFIKFNILSIYSLIILTILFFQAKHNLKFDNTKYNRMWLISIAEVFVVQLIDIICWGLIGLGLPGHLLNIISYIANCLLLISSIITASQLAIFAEYSIEFSEKTRKFLYDLFNPILLINAVIIILSIPFGFYFSIDGNNNYIRGSLQFLGLFLCFLPLFIVFIRMLIKYKKNNFKLKMLLLSGTIFPLFSVLLQMFDIAPVSMLFPSVTISLVIMNSLLINNSMCVDYLTNLQNKRGIDKYFSHMPISISNYIAVFYIDLDAFKYINDTYGHKEGDFVLKSFSKILSDTFRADDLTARIGGDEFLIVTIFNSDKDIKDITDRLYNEIDKFNNLSLKPYKISISIGIKINNPNTIINQEHLIFEADNLMYKQKNSKI